MPRRRMMGDFNLRAQSSSDEVRKTELVRNLVRAMLVGQGGGGEPGSALSEDRVNAAMRLCTRILGTHIGGPLNSGGDFFAQDIRSKVVKAWESGPIGVKYVIRMRELQHRLRALNCVKNFEPMLQLLHSLMRMKEPQKGQSRGMAEMPPRVFSEPTAGLSGIDRVVNPLAAPAVRTSEVHGAGELKDIATDQEHADSSKRSGGPVRSSSVNDVTQRALLRGILYAFQGVDSQYIKYSKEESRYVIHPCLRMSRSQREIASKILEMGWLFMTVVEYIEKMERSAVGPSQSRTQQAFVYSLKEDITEYYRLIAVLGAQLNSDAARAGKGGLEGDGGSTAKEGMTLMRLAIWVQDPMERLKQTATMVSAATHLKGGALATCLHSHMNHGNPLVRALVQCTMVRVCEPLFAMVKSWMFEGELVDQKEGFFIKADSCVEDEMLWQDRYQLDLSLLPKFIDPAVASKILTVGKAINFLRHLCGDSAWIIGPMAKAAAEMKTLEYGNTASLREVVDSCATLTNARLVRLIMEQYRLKSHFSLLKKFFLHGQGDVMVTLVEALGPELDKRACTLFRHNLDAIVDGIIKNSAIAQDESEDLSRIRALLLYGGESDSGWDVFSLAYEVDSPVSAIVTSEAISNYRQVFSLLWRIKRVEWSLASAWRLQTSATHVRLERTLPELQGALHRCSLFRGQMFFLTTNLSNYMMFEVLETSWGTLQEKLNSALTLDDIIEAHNTYMSDIMVRALLHEDSTHVADKLNEVLSIIVEFCNQQENLIIRAMAMVTTLRAELRSNQGPTSRGQWDVETRSASGRRRQGWDPFGMSKIEDTALRYEETLSELVRLLEEQSNKTERLQFLTFRLDFNDYYKDRRAQVLSPSHARQEGISSQGGVSSRPPR